MIEPLLGTPYGNVRARALATGLRTGDEMRSLAQAFGTEGGGSRLSRELAPAGRPAEEAGGPVDEQVVFGLAVCRHLPDPGRRLCDALLERGWVDDLRTLCRQTAQPGPAALPWPIHESHYNTFPLQELRGITSLTALAAALPSGSYRDMLREHLRSATTSVDPGRLDDALLLCYWQKVSACCENLPPLQRQQAEDVLGRRADIDLFRLLWHARRRSLPPATLLEYLPPLGLGRMLSGQRLPAALFWQRVRRHFPGVFLAPGSYTAGERSEVELLRKLRHELWGRLRDAPFGIAGVLAALVLKELEVRDVKAIMAGNRYRVPPAEIEDLLCSLGR